MPLGQIGKYERLDVLGHGASGIVYLAKDTLLGRQVALKQISAQGEERERVLGEARVLDRLRHRNIVQVHNVDQIEGKILIDMEYIRGRNLQDILREQPQLTVEQAVSIASQICEGLAYAHANRTVHRDVKPANIIISSDGVVKLVDFGLAEVLGTNSFAGGAGTYAYMAPEDFHGEEQSDRRSDVWAAGVILYEMLAGVRPFRPAKVKDPFSWKKAVEEDPIRPVSSLRPDVPANVDTIIARALARSKAERYDDAAAMAADLAKLNILGRSSEEHVAALLESHPSYRPENVDGQERDGDDLPTINSVAPPPVRGAAGAVGSEDSTVAAVAPLMNAAPAASVISAPEQVPAYARAASTVPVEIQGFPALADVDDFLRRAPDAWDAACQALDGGSLAIWLRAMGEIPLAEVAEELQRQAPSPSYGSLLAPGSSDRLRDFLYRSGLETADEARQRYNAGVQLFDMGRFIEAAAALRTAANLDPSQAYHFQYLARALRASGDHNGAVAVFDEALRYHPNDRALRREHYDLAGKAVEVNMQTVDFGVLRTGQEKTLKVNLRNTAGGTLQGRVVSCPEWLRVTPFTFSTRHRQPLSMTVDTSKIWQAPSTHHEAVVLDTSGGRQQINVQLSVLPGRKGIRQSWYWYLPLVLCSLAPIAACLTLMTHVGLAAGLIDAGLLTGSAFVITIAADSAWSLRWPLLAIVPFCFAAAASLLNQPGHSNVRDMAVMATTGPIVLLLIVQGFALWTSPRGWGKWQIWSALIALAGLGSAYLLTLFH